VIVSHEHYMWFVVLMTGLVAAYWVLIDSIRLRRALRGDRADLAVRDRIFGSAIGLIVGGIGVGGSVQYLISHNMI
jgi:uncharacterized membrane protein YfcA